MPHVQQVYSQTQEWFRNESYDGVASASDSGVAGYTSKSNTRPSDEKGKAPAAGGMAKVDAAPATTEVRKSNCYATEKGRYMRGSVADDEETAAVWGQSTSSL